MSIQFSDLLSAKARKYGGSATGVQFRQQAEDACNYTLDDIERIVGVSTTRIDQDNEEIALDQQKYQGLISLGMDFYMQDNAEFTTQALAGIEKRYDRMMSDVRRVYVASQNPKGIRGDMS